jgi:hypothetical protein
VAFEHSSFRWFESWSCKAIPRGLPSSLTQHGVLTRALCPSQNAFVAHSHLLNRGGP